MKGTVRFGELRTFLENLGFYTDASERRVLFEHKPSDSVIVLRKYGQNEKVSPTDLAVVQTMLDQRGLIEGNAFDQSGRSE